MDQRKKGFKPWPFRKEEKSHTDKNYKQPSVVNINGVKSTRTSSGGWNNDSKDVKCWGCNGPHVYINFPHNPRRKMAPISMLQEAFIVNDLAKRIPRINDSLEDWQTNHQSTMMEVEGKILNTFVSILIDLGDSLSYIAPKIVEKDKLAKEKQKNERLVQLATGVKRKVKK